MISHHHKTVFVHIPKTAGQSIERVFLSLLDLDWQTRAPLLLRPNDEPRLGPPRLAHLRANEYVKYRYLSQCLFDQYFVFAFVRNPWDRVLSFYRYLGHHRRQTFEQYVTTSLWRDVRNGDYFVAPQWEFIYEKESCIVDFVGRYESLENDFQHVCSKLNLPNIELPVTNVSQVQITKGSAAHNNLAIEWSASARDLVHELYAEDIHRFEYNFPFKVASIDS